MKKEKERKRKRGNAEGSIYHMKDGRWRAALMIGWRVTAEGKRIRDRLVFTGATRHEVAEDLTATLRDRDRGININPQKQTVGAFLAAWLENTARPSVRPKTYRSYEQMVRNHLSKTVPPAEWKERELDAVPGLKDVLLTKLTLPRLQKFFNDKLTAGNSPTLVRYLRVVLRIARQEAVKGDLVPRNVAAVTTPPRVETKEPQPFTPEQAGRFLKAAMGHRLEALFTSALAIGLRSGECSALRWPDVDLDKAEVNVRHTLQRVKHPGEKKGTLTLLPPKSKKSRRRVPLPAVCITALLAHRERQGQERALAGSRWKETDHVFTSTIGTPIDDRKILKEFAALRATKTAISRLAARLHFAPRRTRRALEGHRRDRRTLGHPAHSERVPARLQRSETRRGEHDGHTVDGPCERARKARCYHGCYLTGSSGCELMGKLLK
jgi:integrase